MAMQEYEQALGQGYEFLNNHNQLLHSLKLSRLNADNRTYTENTQGIGNDSVDPSEGISSTGDGSIT
jgi:hypothetical protein